VRQRLALLVAATTSLMLIAFLVPLALLVRTVAEDRATVRATADVQGIVSVVGTADVDTVRLTVDQLTAESRRPVTVFMPDGTLLGAAAPRTPAVSLAMRGRSLTADLDGGREIVVAVLGRPEGTAVIRTVVPRSEITAGVTRAWLLLSALGLVLIALGLVVADLLARSLVRPISELSNVSHRLANAELTARASPAGPPELRAVAGALNHLAGRIQELLREERERVADFSHRLRTPLTALRLEADSLRNPDEAARVTAGVDALQRAVTGLIRRARWRSEPAAAASSDAAVVVAGRVQFWSVLAEDTGRAVDVDIPAGPLPVGVPADDLAAAVDALLGNVFAHTPDGTAFSVRLAASRGEVILTIADAGPGLTESLMRRGASGGGSTGLGLDIARRAAQASGGGLELSTGDSGGAVIRLRLRRSRP
jgi:signal transduction histidine kinase